MILLQVNWWAVLVSALAGMVIGSIWYGPLFGKVYIKAMGMDTMDEAKRAEMRKGMMGMYITQFVASLVTMFVLAVLIGSLGMVTVMGGVTVALWVWVGFIVPVQLGNAIWGGKMILFWLGAFAQLVTMLVAGAIMGSWI